MKGIAAAILFGAAACAPRGSVRGPEASGPANLRVEVFEIVDSPEEDGLSFSVVKVDGAEIGRTEPGLKSARKNWQGRVAPGNRLLRLERWVLPRVSEWVRVRESWQPRERFVRVPENGAAVVTVRYSSEGRRFAFSVEKRSKSP